jgi:hypothetical protein
MLQDRREDLDSEKRKKLLQRLVSELSREHPDLYYQPASEIARQIRSDIACGTKLNADERALMDRLSQRDIEMLLSLH